MRSGETDIFNALSEMQAVIFAKIVQDATQVDYGKTELRNTHLTFLSSFSIDQEPNIKLDEFVVETESGGIRIML